MSALLGIDFGGTAVKLGLVTREGAVLARTTVPFDSARRFEEIATAVCEAGARLGGGRKPEAVGLATPGYADPVTGVLIDGTNNVPALRGQALPAFVTRHLGVPAFIDNDGTCATLGELLFGAGRPFARFALITIGTGIGGGVVIERRVVTGTDGMPPEIGALCLNPDGPGNYSGIRGTLERLASAPAFGIMINRLNLEACIIGGGVSAAGGPLLESVRRHLAFFTWPALHRNVQVLLAQRGNDAGVIGAAAMAASRIESA